MTWTTPFTAVVGNIITAAGWNASARDNLLHLRAIVPDPTASVPLVGASATTAAWGQVGAAGIASDAVTTVKILDANVTAGKLASDSVTEAKLDVLDTPADNEALTYDSATGRMEWQAVSAIGATVPSGLIGAFETAAGIASGWTRFTAGDGRMLVGDGTTFSTTFTAQNSYGSSWSFTPTGSIAVAISAGSDGEGAPSGGAPPSFAHTTHGHGISSQTFTGNSVTWAIPSRAIVWAIKS